MVIDRAQHKQILIELINNMTFKGEFADVIVELRQAIFSASVEKNDKKSELTINEPNKI